MERLVIAILIIATCLTGLKLYYYFATTIKVTKLIIKEFITIFILYLILISTIVYLLHLLDFNIQ